MSTYKEIRGFSIENFTTDPGNPSTGQLWYNDTTAEYKYNSGTQVSAWATANPMGSARYALAGAGTPSATVAFGGFSQPGDTTENKTELYNGSNWTAAAVMPTGQWELCGSGIQTSALAYGGNSPLEMTQSWNGSTWATASGMNLNNQRGNAAGVGESNSSAFVVGGPPGGYPSNSERFTNGEWNTSPALNTVRDKLGAIGTATAVLAFGGDSGSDNLVEEWNDSTWTSKAVLNTGRVKAVGSGLSTLGTAFGGFIAPTTNSAATETWNGTTWSNMTSMNTARKYMGGAGPTSSAGIAFGGQVTPNTSPNLATEKFTSSGGVKTIIRN
tara:strand:- start:5751 stop:6734 length:984 start_codon:yes stop_codon:yes gene_type:complete